MLLRAEGADIFPQSYLAAPGGVGGEDAPRTPQAVCPGGCERGELGFLAIFWNSGPRVYHEREVSRTDVGRHLMPEDKKEMPVDVAGLMEDAFLMGIGVLEMTREKLSGLSGELIERGKMSQSDAKKVADRISEVAGKQQSTLRGMVADETRKALEAAGVPTSDEIASLRREIAELKTMMAGSKPSGEV